MAIRRSAVVEKSPEVVNAGAEAPVTGPVAVPDASQASQDAPDAASAGPGTDGSGAGRKGHTGPRLSWGLTVNGLPLQRHLVDTAREVSKAKGGYATLGDVLEGIKANPIFTDYNQEGNPLSQGGVSLASLVNMLNLRNEWTLRRDRLVIQFSTKPESEGGLGLTIPVLDDKKETEKKWVARFKEKLTDQQWAQMEDQIAKPKPEGRDFPKLVVRRGRRGHGLDMDDI